MTDLEMTRLCAEAMGLRCKEVGDPFGDGENLLMICARPSSNDSLYDPLDDDAQAMALVKEMSIQIHHHGFAGAKASLVTVIGRMRLDDHPTKVTATDLNRAIVECVAKMRLSSSTTQG